MATIWSPSGARQPAWEPHAVLADDGDNAGRVSASPYRWTEPAAIPPRQWLYGRHFIRKFLSVTVSAGGVGKSSLELVEAVSLASGRDLLSGKPIRPRAVWYWNGEDPLEELQRRVQAIALHYGLREADLGGRLFLDSGRLQRIVLASDDRRQGIAVNRPLAASLVETLAAHRIDVLILDPFVSVHAVPENDNGAIDQVAKQLAAIADAADCAVEVVHHVRKGNGGERTIDDARGAVALIAAARSARLLNPMTSKEAAKAGIDSRERRLYFRVDDGKANLAPPAGASWRRLVSVGLGNGGGPYHEDAVGVVTAWQWPDAFAGLTANDLRAVQDRIAAGGQWRADVQAHDWAGKAVAEVLGLDLARPTDRARAKALLTTWRLSGALVVVARQDEARKTRQFVEVGTWVE